MKSQYLRITIINNFSPPLVYLITSWLGPKGLKLNSIKEVFRINNFELTIFKIFHVAISNTSKKYIYKQFFQIPFTSHMTSDVKIQISIFKKLILAFTFFTLLIHALTYFIRRLAESNSIYLIVNIISLLPIILNYIFSNIYVFENHMLCKITFGILYYFSLTALLLKAFPKSHYINRTMLCNFFIQIIPYILPLFLLLTLYYSQVIVEPLYCFIDQNEKLKFYLSAFLPPGMISLWGIWKNYQMKKKQEMCCWVLHLIAFVLIMLATNSEIGYTELLKHLNESCDNFKQLNLSKNLTSQLNDDTRCNFDQMDYFLLNKIYIAILLFLSKNIFTFQILWNIRKHLTNTINCCYQQPKYRCKNNSIDSDPNEDSECDDEEAQQLIVSYPMHCDVFKSAPSEFRNTPNYIYFPYSSSFYPPYDPLFMPYPYNPNMKLLASKKAYKAYLMSYPHYANLISNPQRLHLSKIMSNGYSGRSLIESKTLVSSQNSSLTGNLLPRYSPSVYFSNPGLNTHNNIGAKLRKCYSATSIPLNNVSLWCKEKSLRKQLFKKIELTRKELHHKTDYKHHLATHQVNATAHTSKNFDPKTSSRAQEIFQRRMGQRNLSRMVKRRYRKEKRNRNI